MIDVVSKGDGSQERGRGSTTSRPSRSRRGPLALLAAMIAIALGVAALAGAEIVQQGNLRVTALTQVKPFKLPRVEKAPIAIFVAGKVEAVDGGIPPQLKRLTVKVNRHGRLQPKGLPVCKVSRVQPASTSRALATCGPAVIGSGQFWAHIVLPDQGAYPTRGRILILNGRRRGRPVLLVHIFTSNPFFSSFVIPFEITKLRKGRFGTQLSASLPEALGDWGYVDRIKLTLRRKYRRGGELRSYFSSSCPAPKGVKFIAYPLALASFDFAGDKRIAVKVTKTCGAKG